MKTCGRVQTVLDPPGFVYVLGETFVGIEGVNRACQKQHAGETGGQRGRDRGAGPLETKQKRSARIDFPHVRQRTAPDSMVPFSLHGLPGRQPSALVAAYLWVGIVCLL